MISKEYLSLSLKERSEFIGKVVIMAQSEEYNLQFCNMLWYADNAGFFDRVSPGDPSHPSIKDVDSPIENGPSSPQN